MVGVEARLREEEGRARIDFMSILSLSCFPWRITQAPFDQASVQSDKSLQDDELKKLLMSSLSTKKKNKKKKKASEQWLFAVATVLRVTLCVLFAGEAWW